MPGKSISLFISICILFSCNDFSKSQLDKFHYYNDNGSNKDVLLKFVLEGDFTLLSIVDITNNKFYVGKKHMDIIHSNAENGSLPAEIATLVTSNIYELYRTSHGPADSVYANCVADSLDSVNLLIETGYYTRKISFYDNNDAIITTVNGNKVFTNLTKTDISYMGNIIQFNSGNYSSDSINLYKVVIFNSNYLLLSPIQSKTNHSDYMNENIGILYRKSK